MRSRYTERRLSALSTHPSGGSHAVLPWLLSILTRRLLRLVALAVRSDRSTDLEIVVLRHELAILRR